MSISTSFHFLNANDPEFIAARDGTPEQREEWQDRYGPINNIPGRVLDAEPEVQETCDEYGGWTFELKSFPANATHLYISRG